MGLSQKDFFAFGFLVFDTQLDKARIWTQKKKP